MHHRGRVHNWCWGDHRGVRGVGHSGRVSMGHCWSSMGHCRRLGDDREGKLGNLMGF